MKKILMTICLLVLAACSDGVDGINAKTDANDITESSISQVATCELNTEDAIVICNTINSDMGTDEAIELVQSNQTALDAIVDQYENTEDSSIIETIKKALAVNVEEQASITDGLNLIDKAKKLREQAKSRVTTTISFQSLKSNLNLRTSNMFLQADKQEAKGTQLILNASKKAYDKVNGIGWTTKALESIKKLNESQTEYIRKNLGPGSKPRF